MKWTPVPPKTVIDIAAVSDLIDHIDSSDFDRLFLGVLSREVAIEEVNGIILREFARAEAVGWFGRRADAASRVEIYARVFSKQDRLLAQLPVGCGVGSSYVSSVRAADIEDDDYRWTCFDGPAFRHRVSIARAEPDGWAILGMFLPDPTLDTETIMRLAGIATFAFPLVRRHNGWAENACRPPARAHPADRLDDILGSRFPSLTARERRVCAMTIIGNDSTSIASALAITRSTVLTYRRRAYERLGVSSANALMAELV